MNTKQCVYKNCGNSSAFATKITFFSFPLKDAEKCALWTQMAGCEGINLRSKFLCENHFSTIYISKTPRRTVLLPNAVPYNWQETNKIDEPFDDEFDTEKNVSRDEMILDSMVDENDVIYSTHTIGMIPHNDSATDENIESSDDVLLDEDVPNTNSKVKLNVTKSVKSGRKDFDSMIDSTKKVEQPRNTLPVAESMNHVTKRQKLQTSGHGLVIVQDDHTVRRTVEKKPEIQEEKPTQIDNTIDNPDITTFIYKGEEYIQMPKRIYLQQRAKLDADAKRYKSMVQNIKGIVNAADFS